MLAESIPSDSSDFACPTIDSGLTRGSFPAAETWWTERSDYLIPTIQAVDDATRNDTQRQSY